MESESDGNSKLFRVLSGKWKAMAWVSLIWSGLGCFFSETNLGGQLEYQNARRIEFVVRDKLGHSPRLDPRLRIFTFDDKAVASIKSTELPLADWTAVLRSLRLRKPRAILIDKIFGYTNSNDAGDVDAFVAEIKQHSNLAVGSFLHPVAIPLRPTLDTSRQEFALDRPEVQNPELSSWLPEQNMQVYGPQPEIAAHLQIGQFLYQDQGTLFPWVRFLPNRAIPHLSFYAADHFRVSARGPEVNGKIVPLDRHGMLPINFTSSTQYYQVANSMRSLIERSRRQDQVTDVNTDDIVLLLPLMYTGNADYIETPLGKIPGGLVHATVINSVLTGEWLSPVMNPVACVIFLAAFGTLLGMTVDPKWFWSGLASVLTLVIGGGIMGFSFGGIMSPWFFPSLSLAGAALTMHGIVTFDLRERSRRLNNALSGLVPKDRLAELLTSSTRIEREACEAVVTVMFLDISNFSTTALQLQPKDVFLLLKSTMGRITEIVHKHGGTIDRTMGDGLLCFFGYSYDGRRQENHAEVAVACAREIQRDNVQHAIASQENRMPVWPFRIGINTTSAFIGDLGNHDRIDFTLIGNGVNFAQRLEAACPHHSFLVSLTTFDLSDLSRGKQDGVHRCKIKIKNQSELVEAIEVDPLVDNPDLRNQATKAMRVFLSLDRNDERWPVASSPNLDFSSPFGKAVLIDFSRSGVCISLPTYLAKGVSVTFEVTSTRTDLNQRLLTSGLQTFRTEVRWGRPKDGNYMHGFLFTDVSDRHKQAFFEILREACLPQGPANHPGTA